MIKVVIVDDSKLIRALLSEIIKAAPDMTLVGEAEDPFQAREIIKQTNPDVLTLDIEMPRMDGITFLKNLMRLRPMPVVMLSTLTAEGAPFTLEALEVGAVDFLEKPKINVAEELPRYTSILQEKIRIAAQAHVRRAEVKPASAKTNAFERNWDNLEFKLNHIVAIGASTGGTEAIKEVVTKLPAHFPPVVVTQHIPPVFSTTYAQRLDKMSKMHVHEAKDGQKIEAGHIYIAPGDEHLKIIKKGGTFYCQLEKSALVNRHRPAVDVMFDSLAELHAKHTSAVLLTGMGADGAKGLLGFREKGAFTIAQDENTCVVYGMPKAAVEMGAAEKVLPLDKIAGALVQAAVKK
jgi:two-component system chemotaxis response regulator CheB